MSRTDSLESIKKRYDATININDRVGGVLRCWVRGFKDVTMVCLWVEFPNCNGELTPIELPFIPHTDGEKMFIDIAGSIKIYSIDRPDNWRQLKLF